MARTVDWRAVEALPEFRELQARRRRFVVPATIFFLSWYVAFVLLAGLRREASWARKCSSTGSPSATCSR
jgi:uncharacterized membrane protein (DUF485 family)